MARTRRAVGGRQATARRLVVVAALASALVILGCDGIQGDNGGGGGGSSSGELGDPCQSAGDCLSGVCLTPLSANIQGVPGLCSTACNASADCAAGGVCLPDPTGTVAKACWKECGSAGDCSSGVACVWEPNAGSGVCAAVAFAICDNLVGAGQCNSCAANACCTAYQDCESDVTCGKDFAACAGSSCVAKLASSGDSAEANLGSCMGSACASECSN